MKDTMRKYIQNHLDDARTHYNESVGSPVDLNRSFEKMHRAVSLMLSEMPREEKGEESLEAFMAARDPLRIALKNLLVLLADPRDEDTTALQHAIIYARGALVASVETKEALAATTGGAS